MKPSNGITHTRSRTSTAWTLSAGAVVIGVLTSKPLHADPIAVASYVYDGVSIGEGISDGTRPSTSPAFPDEGNIELTDGLLPAATLFQDLAWVGFRDDDRTLDAPHPQVTFDLGTSHDVETIAVTYLHSTAQAGGTITAPEEVRISVSDDDVTYSAPTSFSTQFDSSAGDEIRVATLDVSALADARYYRLDFRNASQWTFFAEVEFDGVASGRLFAITGIDHSPAADTVTLTWDSRPGETYAVKYSRDLANWDADLDDGVEADDGEQTTRTFDIAGLATEGKLFLRVEKQ